MYQADKKRYEGMNYNRCGKSGLKLPEVSLGLWHNFGDTGNFENMKRMCFTAFDHGITHFDVANNYGPEPGSAEVHLGRILKEEMGAYRDELIITAWIRRHRLRRQWEHLTRQSKAERHCMPGFRIMMGRR